MTTLSLRFLVPVGMILRTDQLAEVITLLGDTAMRNVDKYGAATALTFRTKTKRANQRKWRQAGDVDPRYQLRINKGSEAHTPSDREYEVIFANLFKLRKLLHSGAATRNEAPSRYASDFFFPVNVSVYLPDSMDAPAPPDAEPEEHRPMETYMTGGSSLTEAAVIETMSPTLDFLTAVVNDGSPIKGTERQYWEACEAIETILVARRRKCSAECLAATVQRPRISTTVFPNDPAKHLIPNLCPRCICGSMFLDAGEDNDRRATDEIARHRATADKTLILAPFPWDADTSLYQQTMRLPVSGQRTQTDGPGDGINLADIDLRSGQELSTSLLKGTDAPDDRPKTNYDQWMDGEHVGRIVEDFPQMCKDDNPELFSADGFSRGTFDPEGPDVANRTVLDPKGREGFDNWLDYVKKRQAEARDIADSGAAPHFSSMGWCQRGWHQPSTEADDRRLEGSNPMRDGRPLYPRVGETYGESDSDFLLEDDATEMDTVPRTRVTLKKCRDDLARMEADQGKPHTQARAFLEHPSLHGDDQAVGFLADDMRDDVVIPVRVPARANLFPKVDTVSWQRDLSAIPIGPRYPIFNPDDIIGPCEPPPRVVLAPHPPETTSTHARVASYDDHVVTPTDDADWNTDLPPVPSTPTEEEDDWVGTARVFRIFTDQQRSGDGTIDGPGFHQMCMDIPHLVRGRFAERDIDPLFAAVTYSDDHFSSRIGIPQFKDAVRQIAAMKREDTSATQACIAMHNGLPKCPQAVYMERRAGTLAQGLRRQTGVEDNLEKYNKRLQDRMRWRKPKPAPKRRR